MAYCLTHAILPDIPESFDRAEILAIEDFPTRIDIRRHGFGVLSEDIASQVMAQTLSATCRLGRRSVMKVWRDALKQ